MEPKFFKTPAEFRRWLERNHDKATEVWVGMHKVASGKKSIMWAEAVDVALCFGWIDGVNMPVDEMRRKQRYTPRRKGSKWSKRNIGRVKALKKEGLMHPAGLRAFEARVIAEYSNQSGLKELPTALAKVFRSNKNAYVFFESQPPSYRNVVVHWIVTAKREETRVRRLDQLIQASARGERLGQFYRPAKK